jgi:hypothetical protein
MRTFMHSFYFFCEHFKIEYSIHLCTTEALMKKTSLYKMKESIFTHFESFG